MDVWYAPEMSKEQQEMIDYIEESHRIVFASVFLVPVNYLENNKNKSGNSISKEQE